MTDGFLSSICHSISEHCNITSSNSRAIKLFMAKVDHAVHMYKKVLTTFSSTDILACLFLFTKYCDGGEVLCEGTPQNGAILYFRIDK